MRPARAPAQTRRQLTGSSFLCPLVRQTETTPRRRRSSRVGAGQSLLRPRRLAPRGRPLTRGEGLAVLGPARQRRARRSSSSGSGRRARPTWPRSHGSRIRPTAGIRRWTLTVRIHLLSARGGSDSLASGEIYWLFSISLDAVSYSPSSRGCGCSTCVASALLSCSIGMASAGDFVLALVKIKSWLPLPLNLPAENAETALTLASHDKAPPVCISARPKSATSLAGARWQHQARALRTGRRRDASPESLQRRSAWPVGTARDTLPCAFIAKCACPPIIHGRTSGKR